MTTSPVAAGRLLMHLTANGAYSSGEEDLLVIQRGDGPYVFDTEGRRYVDALSSLYCAQIGYSYAQEISEAASSQMRTLPFSTIWSAAHPTAIELADKLCELAPGSMNGVFFTSGGAESVESAWKIARQYHVLRGEPERTKAIARRDAYHGLTLGALSFTADPALKDVFGPPAVPVRHVSNTGRFRRGDLGDDAAFVSLLVRELEEAIREEGPTTIGMLIAEPVQNRGGCITPPEGYWQALRNLADRYGFLLVADEVITAFGRLGQWFGAERYDAQPDIVTTAKGLTSAYAPMGAVLVSDRVAGMLRAPGVVLNHGFTFAGHPLCAAVALKSIEILERDKLFANVSGLEPHLSARMHALKRHRIVGDVRGSGFFFAVELVPDGGEGRFTTRQREVLIRRMLPDTLRGRGVLARVYDRAEPLLQIAPPLISDRALLDTIVDVIDEVLAEGSALLEGDLGTFS